GLEQDARQIARIVAPLVDRRDRLSVARPQQHVVAGAQHGGRERRAPGAAAEDGDARALTHAFAPRLPAPISGAAGSSSGQRERGAKASGSSPQSPARMRSSPAQATITP